MTRFQRKNAAFDARADTWLDRLRASKWSGLILLAAAAVVLILAVWALA